MKYSFNDLSAQEADLIGQGLGELPLRVALPLLEKLKAQIAEQQKDEAGKNEGLAAKLVKSVSKSEIKRRRIQDSDERSSSESN